MLQEPEREAFTKAVSGYRIETRDLLSPAERGETFEVPRLMAEIQGTLEFADTDLFMEDHAWSLRDHSPKLGEGEFAINETTRSFEIDLDGNRIAYRFATEEKQLALDVDVEAGRRSRSFSGSTGRYASRISVRATCCAG